MKINRTTFKVGEEPDKHLKSILQHRPQRIIHTEEISAGEVRNECDGYQQVTKLRIWYYDY